MAYFVGAYNGRTGRLVAVRKDKLSLLFLRECPNLDIEISTNLVHCKGFEQPLIKFCMDWIFNLKTRSLHKDESRLSDEDVAVHQLSNAILEAYEEIVHHINQVRNYTKPGGFLMQSEIYQLKLIEAEAIVSGNLNRTFIFIPTEADLLGISSLALANQVIFEHQVMMGFLQKTEILRIKYSNRLKQVSTPDECTILIADLKRDLYDTGQI